jgi:predicted amidohydrolase YtcJ
VALPVAWTSTSAKAPFTRPDQAPRAPFFHYVTRAELVYALGALREAGATALDRIEHASITPPELLEEVRALGLTVVSQPGFIAERGDAYPDQVEAADQPWLYRLRGFLEAGVPLAGSTDAPFGAADRWAAMQAAVSRRSAGGRVLGAGEALSPEQALALFTTPLKS